MAETKVLAKKEEPKVPAKVELSLNDIKKYICPEATDQEAFLFLKLCQSQNLNPFIQDAYLIKYKGQRERATMVVGKYVFAKRAESHPDYDGMKAGIIVRIDNDIKYLEGSFVPPDATLFGGWAEVHRKSWKEPVRTEVSLEKYLRKKSDGTTFRNWAIMPATLIRKVALMQSWREAFPNLLGGLYGAEEMAVEVKDVEITEVKKPKEESVEESVFSDERISPAEVKSLHTLATNLGRNKEKIKKYLKRVWHLDSSKDILKGHYKQIVYDIEHDLLDYAERSTKPPDEEL